ncbi:S-adenosylmethionine-dependent methyltransferase, putative [Ricinus communis]|uniref:S-adenosylmethionine-dependent methyltransferase, putative n=1 Tax=Ricinus communis TaxID=3988 RepID=B9SPN8_RICCO|nr:S-adenosylmethionine-dependent methyltransferase, putative [Ricinus communis]
MLRDVSSCNTYNYGDALYWDARYVQEGGSFDWYQRYSSLRPFVRRYIPLSSRVLMVGCGNALMSEDMVKDGYEDIMNIDISSVAIDMMRKKYEYFPQLKYMQLDVRDMSFFPDESFNGVIDKGMAFPFPLHALLIAGFSIMSVNYMLTLFLLLKITTMDFWLGDSHSGTLDSLMCGNDAPISAAQMLGEVSRSC